MGGNSITEGYVTNDRLQYAIDKHSADITKMLSDGKLERFYSEKTHPNQKYKAK